MTDTRAPARATGSGEYARPHMEYVPAPNDPPTTTVSFGTRAHATAFTIFAPCLAMPPCSYSRPTMNPVMFCRKTRGMPRWSHSSMKCAPLSADSPNSTPLLATIPTRWPERRANPVTSVSPYSRLNSVNEPPSTRREMISRAS